MLQGLSLAAGQQGCKTSFEQQAIVTNLEAAQMTLQVHITMRNHCMAMQALHRGLCPLKLSKDQVIVVPMTEEQQPHQSDMHASKLTAQGSA